MNPNKTVTSGNPLLEPWTASFAMPPFAAIAPEHFLPAFESAFAAENAEMESILGSGEEPTFANTIEALERAGPLLERVYSVFSNLTSAETSEALQAIEREIEPRMTRHVFAILHDERMFARVDAVWAGREAAGLSAEQRRVLERHHTTLVRTGAALPPAAKARFAAIRERLSVLATSFGQNVLADEADGGLVLDDEAALAGLPEVVREVAARAASDRGLAGKHLITLNRSSVEPFLQFSTRRDLREKAHRLWIARGRNGGPTDNAAIAAETVALRAELASLMGSPSYAAYRLEDTMAKTPEAVHDFLMSVWTPALARARQEEAELQALARTEGENTAIAPSDWRYYAERLRKTRFALDEADIKPYLALDGMIEAAFATATALFGLIFEERRDLPVYHPDVRTFEVKDRDGRHVGVFLGDYFARPSKHGGAWMSAYRAQRKLGGDVRPIIVNVMNFARSANGPTLLSFDDARTLFHEFGHALHGLLSDVIYPKLAGTRVSRDFVEFPSQLYEHWLEQRDVLRRHARHYRTGEPMDEALITRILRARTFNQGCSTLEYLASALVDLGLHAESPAAADVAAFETATLARLGMPDSVVMRHASAHFTHVFSGGYAAGYYAYLWSEILDADGFAAFEEAGDIYDPATAERLHTFIYAAGNLREPADAYMLFRGRMPNAEAVLKQRGLVDLVGA